MTGADASSMASDNNLPLTRARLAAARPEARRIAEFLERDFGDLGVAVSFFDNGEEWTVEAWFPPDTVPDPKHAVEAAIGGDVFGAPLSVISIPEQDWVAKSQRALAPVSAGRIIVHGSHNRRAAPPTKIGIRIDAGQAFGTGHHGTTRGCLLAIERQFRRRRFVNPLDIGTGSGVLAIAITKLGRVPVLATDNDPLAVEISAHNARQNHMGPLFHAVLADGMAHSMIRNRAPYDLIAANILAEPLMRLAPEIGRNITDDGIAILSGLLPHQRQRVVTAYRLQGLRLLRAENVDGWSVLTLTKSANLGYRRQPV